MPKYNIEGNIDFYSSLYSSLDYDSDKDQEEDKEQDKDKDKEQTKDKEHLNKKQICEITGTKLTNHFVTLECKHMFNYDALYTEICKQKYDFQSYTTDVLSKTDIMKIRESKLDYYIKCPYCRHIQFELLPYHEELPFVRKYGVNTCDTDFKVIKTSYVPSSLPPNYTYTLYGYKFVKGVCCKTNLVNGKMVPCWNSFTTPIVAPDGLIKELCPIHVKPEVKVYKLEIKKKEIEDKLKAKMEAKEKALEAKALKSVAKTICVPCTAVLKTGLRKGETCGQKVSTNTNNLCKRHASK